MAQGVSGCWHFRKGQTCRSDTVCKMHVQDACKMHRFLKSEAFTAECGSPVACWRRMVMAAVSSALQLCSAHRCRWL